MLKLAFVFAFIIVLLSRRFNLGLVLLLASAILGLLFEMPAVEILAQGGRAIIDIATLRLVAAVLLITTLGELLRVIKSLERLVNSLQDLVHDPRLVMAIVPALIGLLPMPGGAMLSAPMVQEVGTQQGLSPERKTYVNYWFRHVWEYVFPLYPALILTAGLLEIPLHRLLLAQAPLTVGAIAGGVLVGLRDIKRQEQPDPTGARPARWLSLKELLLSIWPILLVIVLNLALRLELALGLTVAILLTVLLHRVPGRDFLAALRRGLSPQLLLLVVGIMVFKQMVLTSGAAEALTQTIAAWPIPLVVTTTVVPLIIGLLVGLALSMVGIVFPLLLPLLVGSDAFLGHAVLAYAAGFTGILLSPVHLCLALTREYFGARWAKLYRLLLPSAAILALAAAAAWFLV